MPNVSLCEQENEVHYNPIVPETRLVVKYNVTDTSSETTLLFDTTPFIDMEIDGVTQPSVVSSYAFNTLGIHTVKYTLVDPTTIGCYFDGVDKLSYFDGAPISEITIPNSVTSIGERAFQGCSSLTSVTMPNSVTSIGERAFSSCGLRSIGGIDSGADLEIPNSVINIGNGAFAYCRSLTEITIPDSVTSVSNMAFNSCGSLTSVTIGNGVTSIGQDAFQICTGLTSVTIGNGVTSIGDRAFYDCSSLTSITIPNSVTSIGNYAFQDCTSLSSATIGNGVTSIGDGFFTNCSGLQSITSLSTTPPNLGSYLVFYNTNNCPIYVPAESVEAYKAASGWRAQSQRIQAIQ